MIEMLPEKSKKRKTSGPTLHNLQISYPEYSYQFILVIIGALGSIPCNLKYNLKCLGFSEKEVNKQTKMLQIKSITGSVKIVKSFLKFKCWSDCVSYFTYNRWPIFTLFLVITFSFTACAISESIHSSLVSSSLSLGYTFYLTLIWISCSTLFQFAKCLVSWSTFSLRSIYSLFSQFLFVIWGHYS